MKATHSGEFCADGELGLLLVKDAHDSQVQIGCADMKRGPDT